MNAEIRACRRCGFCHPRLVLGLSSAPSLADSYLSAGDRLAYRIVGHGSPVIVLAGGPGLDAAYMMPIAEEVAAAGHQAILPELRGTGASRDAAKDAAMLSVAGSIADIEALRVAVGAERVVLLGHSFGGGMAQAYAQAHPGQVAGLILLDSVGTELSPAPDAALAQSWMQRLGPDDQAAYATARAKGDTLAAIKLKFRASISDPVKAKVFTDSLPPIAEPSVQERLSAAFKADYHVTAGETAFPVAIIYGAQDWIRAWQPALSAAYPRASVALIPETCHFPWIDDPAGTAGAIAAALKRTTYR